MSAHFSVVIPPSGACKTVAFNAAAGMAGDHPAAMPLFIQPTLSFNQRQGHPLSM